MSRKLFADFSMYTKTPIILREKCPYLEFFRFVLSYIWTEYVKLLCKFLYSVQMWENKDQKRSEYRPFLRSVICKNEYTTWKY